MSLRCKFCGVGDGFIGRTNKPVHINRDYLCGPCYTLLEKVKRQPEKIRPDEWLWFSTVCKENMQSGAFVPIAQRRELRNTVKIQWRCKKCGCTGVLDRDNNYTNYCVKCADEIRRGRDMHRNNTGRRKTRSDKKS